MLPGYVDVSKVFEIEDERLKSTKAEYRSAEEHVTEELAAGNDTFAMMWNNRMNFVGSRLLSEARSLRLL